MSESSQDPLNQTAFADALQRAQQIAARIKPSKRPLDDYVEPESKKMARNSNALPPTNLPGENVRETFVQKGTSSVVIMIPKSKVGLIIGRGGETIKQLQGQSGAKLFIVQDDSNMSDEKPLRVSGDSSQVEAAKQLIQDIIGENKNNDFKQDEKQQQYEYGESLQIEVLVPKAAVGLVIGKGGDMIKKIQSETGAKVQFHQPKDAGPGDRRCYVTGKHTNVDNARQRIEEIIDSVCPGRSRNGDGGEFTFTVPASKCGLIIGRGGETIKSIIQYSGVHCELDKSYTGEDRAFIIRGDEKQIEAAQKIICKKIHMQIDLVPTSATNNPQTVQPGLAMGYYQNYSAPYEQQQHQQQWGGAAASQTGQPDYSLQWAEYFRHMQSQSGVNSQASAPVANSAFNAHAVGNSEQADYSAQWIEYYRQSGKHAEAEAIEKLVRDRNLR